MTTMRGLAHSLLKLAVIQSIYVIANCFREDVHIVVHVHVKAARHKNVGVVGTVWTNPNMEVAEH